jgi:hypothetical protein
MTPWKLQCLDFPLAMRGYLDRVLESGVVRFFPKGAGTKGDEWISSISR